MEGLAIAFEYEDMRDLRLRSFKAYIHADLTLKDAVRDASEAVIRAIRRGMEKASPGSRPYPQIRTGTLASALTYDLKPLPDGWGSTIGVNLDIAPYAEYLLRGGVGVFRAKEYGVRAWPIQKKEEAEVRFRAEFSLPLPGYRFLEAGLRDARDDISFEFRKAVEHILGYMKRRARA